MLKALWKRIRWWGIDPTIAYEMDELLFLLEDVKRRGNKPGALDEMLRSRTWDLRRYVQEKGKPYVKDKFFDVHVPPGGDLRTMLQELVALGVDVEYAEKVRVDYPQRPNDDLSGLSQRRMGLVYMPALGDRDLEARYIARRTLSASPYTFIAYILHARRQEVSGSLPLPMCVVWKTDPLNFNSFLLDKDRQGKLRLRVSGITQGRDKACWYAEEYR